MRYFAFPSSLPGHPNLPEPAQEAAPPILGLAGQQSFDLLGFS